MVRMSNWFQAVTLILCEVGKKTSLTHFIAWDKVTCSLGWPQSHRVAKDGLKLVNLLLPSTKCWNYRCYTAVQVYIFCMQSIYRKRLKQMSVITVAQMIATQSCMCLLPWFLNYYKFINLIFNDVSECSAYRILKHTIGVCHGWSEPVLVNQASSHSSWVAEQGQGLWSGPAVERSFMSA